jgi:hypothetical protein
VLTQDAFRSLLEIIWRNITAFNERAYTILADIMEVSSMVFAAKN